MGQSHQRGESPGQCQSLPTHLSPATLPDPQALARGLGVVLLDMLPPADMSRPAPRGVAIPAPSPNLMISSIKAPPAFLHVATACSDC